MNASVPAGKSSAGKLVFASVGLAMACGLLVWQLGVFGAAAGPDPSAPPPVTETPEQQKEHEQLEDQIREWIERNGEPPGSN